ATVHRAEIVETLKAPLAGAHRLKAGKLAAHEKLAVIALFASLTGRATAATAPSRNPLLAAGKGFRGDVLPLGSFAALTAGAALAAFARLDGNPHPGNQGADVRSTSQRTDADHHV